MIFVVNLSIAFSNYKITFFVRESTRIRLVEDH